MPGDPLDLLRTHGLQVTAQRLAVLRALEAEPHGTAGDVLDGVRAEIGSISRQAVYDTLTLLTERDLVRRIQPAGLVARYERRVGDNHHHLVCRHCDRLVDVDCALGRDPVPHPGRRRRLRGGRGGGHLLGHLPRVPGRRRRTDLTLT